MATPRARLVSNTQPMFYHLTSRCVRKSHLCGIHGRKDYSHRKKWLLQRLNQLAQSFAIEVHAYAIMSNHFHLVVYYDPTAAATWPDKEVADRWLIASPPRNRHGQIDTARLQTARQNLLNDRNRLNQIRTQLGSQSTFMQMLKQPIARRANLEDGQTGHFFEQRFYSGALLTEAAILAAMAYVDLNPIRSKIAASLESSDFTSLAARLRKHELKLPMRPIVSGLIRPKFVLKIMLADYLDRLQELTNRSGANKTSRWRQQVALIKKRQRAFGSELELRTWTAERNMQFRETPMS